MLKEFRNFIAKGNVMDMAVGIIVGAAFTAIVKSIEFGFDNKMEGKVEIIDEKGGETGFFQTALQQMEKCVPNLGTGNRIRFKVGWIGVDCNGVQVRKLTEEKAASITQITSQVSNGLIRFSINFVI